MHIDLTSDKSILVIPLETIALAFSTHLIIFSAPNKCDMNIFAVLEQL